MPRRDACAAWIGLFAALCAHARADDEAPALHRAPIEIRQVAPFVQLPLPASAYEQSESPGLDDLRIVDARGARIPYAFLAPRAEARRDETRKPAKLYPLPSRPAADGSWPAPIDITLDGNRVQVRRSTAAPSNAPDARSAGWVADLGMRTADTPVPAWLRLHWSGPAEFSAGYRLETSDDLRTWRAAGAGQVLALASTAGPLTQPDIALPASPARFVRLVWTDPASAPQVDGAEAVVDARHRVALDPPVELVKTGQLATADAREPKPPAGALVFDLGGDLPLVSMELRFASGTRVAPVRVQARERADEAWRELGAAVFYRVERDGVPATAPPLELTTRARWIRVVPDPRAGSLDATTTALAVRAQLASIVFPMQGEPPYALLAGIAHAAPAALPAGTLVAALDSERPRFGKAALGAWSPDEAAARRAEADRRTAEWRPRLLWAVLLAGVGALAFMVWRLARAPDAPGNPPQPSPPA